MKTWSHCFLGLLQWLSFSGEVTHAPAFTFAFRAASSLACPMLDKNRLHRDPGKLKEDLSCPQPARNLRDVIWTSDLWTDTTALRPKYHDTESGNMWRQRPCVQLAYLNPQWLSLHQPRPANKR